MEVELLITRGNGAARVVPVKAPEFFIGRGPDCHLRPNSHLISRHHCVILTKNGGVAVRDSGSTNGTLVNGEKICGEQALKDGDHLTVGSLEFEVRLTAYDYSSEPSASETAAIASASTTTSSIDNRLDIPERLHDTELSAASGLLADTKQVNTAGNKSGVARKACKLPEYRPTKEVSEESKNETRRRCAIPGVSKATQARRVYETPQDAATVALNKLRHR
ncbi:MAG: FHA domain-containing protein [Thermoguttaceae bacterium]